jgi:NADPH-dependent 2,4-dienoyl-CoA reductase/sulfur reductase-like enzyme/nitrite reductase/ring-hydroxylating ferredoxin subunit
MASESEDTRIDLCAGIDVSKLADGAIVAGRVGEDDAMLVKSGDALYAAGVHCTHYHGPLDAGLVVGDSVRCPWHHACFSLKSGEALQAPALDPIACWRVERIGDVAHVREKIDVPRPGRARASAEPESVLIVGGGAAGLAAAEMLRRLGYERPVTLLSADADPPCDRPNLSKDFLAGTASEDWIPLRSPEFYAEQGIELLLDARATALDVPRKRLRLEGGRELGFGALLLATGADPVRLDVPGAAPSQVFYLRSYADSRAIVARTAGAKRALVVGASFIGLEVAASLRTRGIEVHVVGLEALPMQRVLGDALGRFVRSLHESHGVVFHLGATLERMQGASASISDGTTLDVDFVVIGVGVRPAIALAEAAGLALDRGVLVDEHLQTSAPGIYAAGDIARWPDARTGERIRVEHWVVAERQGQSAARNLLGQRERFDAVPFFWSQHYDLAINYVGHASAWDAIDIDGSIEQRDARVGFSRAGRVLAVATLGRDRQSLEAERALELASR